MIPELGLAAFFANGGVYAKTTISLLARFRAFGGICARSSVRPGVPNAHMVLSAAAALDARHIPLCGNRGIFGISTRQGLSAEAQMEAFLVAHALRRRPVRTAATELGALHRDGTALPARSSFSCLHPSAPFANGGNYPNAPMVAFSRSGRGSGSAGSGQLPPWAV